MRHCSLQLCCLHTWQDCLGLPVYLDSAVDTCLSKIVLGILPTHVHDAYISFNCTEKRGMHLLSSLTFIMHCNVQSRKHARVSFCKAHVRVRKEHNECSSVLQFNVQIRKHTMKTKFSCTRYLLHWPLRKLVNWGQAYLSKALLVTCEVAMEYMLALTYSPQVRIPAVPRALTPSLLLEAMFVICSLASLALPTCRSS